jgi:hypothetical protein
LAQLGKSLVGESEFIAIPTKSHHKYQESSSSNDPYYFNYQVVEMLPIKDERLKDEKSTPLIKEINTVDLSNKIDQLGAKYRNKPYPKPTHNESSKTLDKKLEDEHVALVFEKDDDKMQSIDENTNLLFQENLNNIDISHIENQLGSEPNFQNDKINNKDEMAKLDNLMNNIIQKGDIDEVL